MISKTQESSPHTRRTAQVVGITERGEGHPRVRGEQPVAALMMAEKEGSSPHAQGAASAARPTMAGAGSITAYTGSRRAV